jgi:hypothetical protein
MKTLVNKQYKRGGNVLFPVNHENNIIENTIHDVAQQITTLVQTYVIAMKRIDANGHIPQMYSSNNTAKSDPTNLIFVYMITPNIKPSGEKTLTVNFKNITLGEQFRKNGIMTKVFNILEMQFKKITTQDSNFAINVFVSDVFNIPLARYFIETRGYTPLNRNGEIIESYNKNELGEYINHWTKISTTNFAQTDLMKKYLHNVPTTVFMRFKKDKTTIINPYFGINPILVSENNTTNITAEHDMWENERNMRMQLHF